MKLQGAVMLITGANRGIGLASAEAGEGNWCIRGAQNVVWGAFMAASAR